MNIQSHRAVTPLRQRMIEDMAARNLGRHSQRSHLSSCERFAAFLEGSPDTATADDIRRFQLFLIESGASICNRNRIMTGVRFLFRVTLRRHDLAAEIYHLKEPQKVPLVMSQDEIRRLLAMAATIKLRTMLSLAYGCGLRAGEVVRLRVGDIPRVKPEGRLARPEHHPHRPGQGPQGPQRDAAGRYPGPLAAVLEGPPEVARQGCGHVRALALSRAQGEPAADHAAARAPLPGDGQEGRDHQAGEPAFAAPLLRHPFARARCRHPGDPGAARSRQAGDDGALHARGDRHDFGGGHASCSTCRHYQIRPNPPTRPMRCQASRSPAPAAADP